MGWDPVPWLVGGGAEHSSEVGRVLAYAALGGSEGVIGINDCRALALATPGTSIRITTGGCAMLNRSTGGTSQAYIGRVSTEDVVAVPANGPGSTRYDLVVARVKDPQYPPWSPPSDPAIGPYVETAVITNVPSTTVRASQLALGYPAYALARIAVPPSTATITQAMITDLRNCARPRIARYLKTTALGPSDQDSITVTSPTSEPWPDASSAWTMDVPEWATTARVLAIWSGIYVPPGSNYKGAVWATVGSVETQHTAWEAGTITSAQRFTFTASDDIAIPSAMRGTTVATTLRAWNSAGSNFFVYLDQYSSISLDVEFLERADLA